MPAGERTISIGWQAFAFISRPIFSVVTKRQIPSYENAPKTVVIVRIFLIQFDFSSLTSPKVWKEEGVGSGLRN